MESANGASHARVSSVKQSGLSPAEGILQNSDVNSLKASNDENNNVSKEESAEGRSPLVLSPRSTIETAATRYNKKWLKRAVVLYPIASSLALVSLLVFWLHARIKRPPTPPAPPIEVPTEALVENFLNKFVKEVQPTCFLQHQSFASNLLDARMAKKSFEELIAKAQHWHGALKAKKALATGKTAAARAAAPAAARGSKVFPPGPAAEGSTEGEGPSSWEAQHMRLALICYNLPFMEEAAGFIPYHPLEYGNFKYSAERNSVVLLSGVATNKERVAEIRERHKDLSAHAFLLRAWVDSMLQALEELQETEEMKLSDDAEETQKTLREINQARKFFKSLSLYADKRFPPSPPKDEIPTPEDLQATDLFVLKAASTAEASFGVLAEPELMLDSLSTQTTEPGEGAPNRFVPPWMTHLLLGRLRDLCTDCVKLRLHVAATGPPAFAVGTEASLDDFVALLNNTLEHEQEKQRLDTVPLGSSERNELEKKLVLTEMYAELAAAASMIDYQRRAMALAELKGDEERRRNLVDGMAAAYTHLSGMVSKWAGAARGGRIPINRADSELLAVALQQLVNVSLLARRTVLVKEKPEEATALSISLNLQAVFKKQLAQVAKGPLKKRAIVPAWFANLV